MNVMFVVAVVVVILVEQTTAFTTFGGAEQRNGQTAPAQPPQAKMRECKSDSQCLGIINTFCMNDWRDGKLQCLCASRNPPTNGYCPHWPKALGLRCKADEECIPNAYCSVYNSTSNANSTRICMCPTGFEEEDHDCRVQLKDGECRSDSECSGIANTLCMNDWRDGVSRCLCVERNPPYNERCPMYPKALGSPCKADEDCVPDALCSVFNSTSNANSTGICMCKSGFEEEDHECRNPEKGPECKSDSECTGVTNYFCLKDWRDNKKRCLCLLRTPPTRGVCPLYPRPLGSPCTGDNDICVSKAKCVVSDSTSNSNSSRICLCPTGFEEKDHVCSSTLGIDRDSTQLTPANTTP